MPSPCSPIDVDRAVRRLDAGVDHDRAARLEAVDAVAERLDDAGAVRAEDARLRHRRQALADPDVEVVQRRGAQPDEHLARGRHGIRHLLEHEHLRPAVLVDPNRLHGGQTIRVTRARTCSGSAEELGLDVVGATPGCAVRRRRSGTFASAARAASSPT